MTSLSSAPGLYPSFTKAFTVDYFAIRDDMWQVQAGVQDPVYNVVVSMDVSVPSFIVLDASARFLRYPRRECGLGASTVKKLIGVDASGPVRDLLRREFLGPKGCDTLFNLVNCSGKFLAHIYKLRKTALGAMTAEQFASSSPGAPHCAAHLDPGYSPVPFLPRDCVPVPQRLEAGSELQEWETGAVQRPVGGRSILVEYFELSDRLWRVRSHLEDFKHDILLELLVSTDDLMVQDADIMFLRQPSKGCTQVLPRIKSVVGSCLATDFRQRVDKGLLGENGCGNGYVMLNSMLRGFLQFSWWRRSDLGTITAEQEALCATGLAQDCAAAG